VDLCETALQLGAGFVARGFSGDKRQLVPLLKAAIAHKGFSLVDVISPCVTFNNTETSTKSYHWVRDHMDATVTFDFVPFMQEITADYDEGATRNVTLHDGSVIHLHKSDDTHDVTSRRAAIDALERHREKGQVLTGIIHVNETLQDAHAILETTDAPLNSLREKELCPGDDALRKLMDSYR
jgi:2-oxoglutarate ferredoxin oxidoreductase subunit beta